MWWLIIGLTLILGIAYLVLSLAGNWRASLNQVITQYVAWKQMEPNYSDEEIFNAVLDHRYKKPGVNVGGIMLKMYERKNGVRDEIRAEIESRISVIDKYNLPILIYAALVIEENNYLLQKKFKCTEDALAPIIEEVKRQGFSKYI